jgi:DUF1680 family protein
LRATIDGTAFNVLQETQYPFEDRIRFTVDAAAPARLTLWLRRPAWSAAVHLDGIEGKEHDGWIVIDRRWQGRTSFTLRFDVPVRAETYPAGEVAVLRGPLQFVLPISHRARERVIPARADWPDVELLADDRVAQETLPLIDRTHADLGFVLERVATDASLRPWHESPLRLRNGAATLVPIGCAPLRRADFRSYPGQPEHEA